MTKLKHFTWEEFDSPDLPNSGKMFMDREFVYILDNARDMAGIAFHINSGYRTKDHNKKVGGVVNSTHLEGIASDIHAPTSEEKFIIVKALIDAGFERIFIYDNFIHVDRSQTKPRPSLRAY